VIGKIPKDSLIYLTFCLFGILLFLFLGILPSSRKVADLERDITEIKARIEEQKTLFPLYRELKKKGKRTAFALPLPAKKELPKEKIENFTAEVKKLALREKIEITTIAPSLQTLSTAYKTVSLELTARGDYLPLRNFLIALGGIPYLLHIEELELTQQSQAMEIKMKFWILSG